MTEINNLIKNIAIDIFIITSIWNVLNNNTHKIIFGTGSLIYAIKKYI